MGKVKKDKKRSSAAKGKQAYEVQQNTPARLARREQELAARAEANRQVAAQFATQYTLDPHTDPPTTVAQLKPLTRQFEYLLRAGDYNAALAVLDQVVEWYNDGSSASFGDKLYRLSFADGSEALSRLLVPAAAPQLGLNRMTTLLGKLNVWNVALLLNHNPEIINVNLRMLTLFEQAAHQRGTINALDGLVNQYIARREGKSALEYQQRLLAMVEQIGDQREIISAVMTMAYIYRMLHQEQAAEAQRARIDQIIAAADTVADKLATIVAVVGSSRFHDDWIKKYETMAIELASQVDVNRLDYDTSMLVATFLHLADRKEEELLFQRRVAELAAQSGDTDRHFDALSVLSELYNDLERPDEAFATLQQMVSVSEPLYLPGVLRDIIEQGIKLSRWPDTLPYAEQLLQLVGEHANQQEQMLMLIWLIAIYRASGREQDAEFYWQRVQGMINAADTDFARLELLHHLSHYLLDVRMPQLAIDNSITLENLANETHNPMMQIAAMRDRAAAYAMLGHSELALATWQAVLPLAEQNEDDHSLAATLVNIGQLHEHEDRAGEALEYYQRAAQRYDEIGDYEEYEDTLTLVANLYDKLGQHDEAIAARRKISEIEGDDDDSAKDGSFRLISTW